MRTDLNPRHKSAVIDLLGRGYLLWQSHVDLKGLVKSILSLSFSEGEHVSCIKAARFTISQLASYNPALFMVALKEELMTSKKVKDRENGLWLIRSIAKRVGMKYRWVILSKPLWSSVANWIPFCLR